MCGCFCFNDTATTEIYTYLHTLSLHYALPCGTIGKRDALIKWDERVLDRDPSGAPLTRWDGETMKPHLVTGKPVPDEAARVEVYRYVKTSAAARSAGHTPETQSLMRN